MRKCCWLPLVLAIALASLPGQVCAQSAPGTERLIFGTVVAIDFERSLITLRPSNLFGRLQLNLRSYRVKQPILIDGLHSGDRVKAVLSNSDGMLHRLRRLRNCQLYACGANGPQLSRPEVDVIHASR